MSWFLAFVGFALLIMLHEAGHFAAAKAVGMRVERFSLFFPPFIWRWQGKGETEYAIGAIPLGGYVKITGMNPDHELPEDVRDRAYHAQPVWKRIVVIAAGPLVNLVLALVLLFVFFWQIGEQRHLGVDRLEKGYPAAAVLDPGDRLVAVDGKPVNIDTDAGRTAVQRQIGTHRCAQERPTDRCRAKDPVNLTVERDGRRIQVQATPLYDAKAVDPQGNPQPRMRLGFAYGRAGPRETLPVGESVTESLDRFWFVTWETIKLPARLFDAEKRKEVGSVVGGYEVTRRTILSRVADVVIVLAVISLSLAIINLFPFLPLDGGHIFFAIVEKIRRRPVPLAVMERAGVIGFMLVIGIFILGLSNDIDRLSNGEFDRVR
ncbi:MAG: RIP metalloprotease [Actinomycetota bacterium]|nr:RIP metalloprotease [Actinomycetota bacterium]